MILSNEKADLSGRLINEWSKQGQVYCIHLQVDKDAWICLAHA